MSSRIDLRVSPSYPVAFICALPWLLLTALVVLITSGLNPVLLALAAITGSGAIFQYRRTGLLVGANAITGLRVEGEYLYARLGSGKEYPVLTAGESRVSAGFAILKLRRTGTISKTHPVVLAALTPGFGNTSPDAFRQLRVWLRLGRSSAVRQAGDQQPLSVQETQ
ncbi:MAG: hypothetical protein ABR522_10410 [Marinobacter sp.]